MWRFAYRWQSEVFPLAQDFHESSIWSFICQNYRLSPVCYGLRVSIATISIALAFAVYGRFSYQTVVDAALNLIECK